ncbi:hypothetical protein [Hahella ganghwensis]|uniref:hypothetical protein n=1 Tax=Hahella ganghwensis TaxID=286420 RepID=UPI00036FE375|nr:hypothetical protein [Hahella ganghwensis]
MKTNLLAAILAVIVVVLQLFLMQQRSTEHKAQESESHMTQNSVSSVEIEPSEEEDALTDYDFRVSFLSYGNQHDWSQF